MDAMHAIATFGSREEAQERATDIDWIKAHKVQVVEINDMDGNKRWAIQVEFFKFLRQDGYIN